MPRRSAIIRVALGVLLLLTAGLKLDGLSVSAVPQVGWFAQSSVPLAVAEWEAVLGLWLLSGAYPLGSWVAALGTFLTFAIVSGNLGSVGVASCGCFGTIHASPWYAFAVDVAAVALLALARPHRGAEPDRSPSATRGLFLISVAVAFCSGLLTLTGAIVYGSVEMGLARLRGEPLVADPAYVDFGDVPAGTSVLRQITVNNFSSEPIHLIGGTADCTCITTGGLPVEIPPGGSALIPIRVAVPSTASGHFTRTAEIRTNSDRKPVLRLVIGSHVIPTANEQ